MNKGQAIAAGETGLAERWEAALAAVEPGPAPDWLQTLREQAAGAFPSKRRVSTISRLTRAGPARRTTIQSFPPSRRRRVSHPAAVRRRSSSKAALGDP